MSCHQRIIQAMATAAARPASSNVQGMGRASDMAPSDPARRGEATAFDTQAGRESGQEAAE